MNYSKHITKQNKCQVSRVGQIVFFLFFLIMFLSLTNIKYSFAQEQEVINSEKETILQEIGNSNQNNYLEISENLSAKLSQFRENMTSTMKQFISRLIDELKSVLKKVWNNTFDFRKQKQQEISNKIEEKVKAEVSEQADKIKEDIKNTVNEELKNEIDQGTTKIEETGDKLQDFLIKVFSLGRG